MEPITASAARFAGSSLLRLQSDERLARLAALDNHAAFEAIVGRYRPELLRASRRVVSDGRAEDAVQQALLKAHEALLRNGPPEKLRPWLHRIALNSSLDILGEEAAEELPPEDQIAGGESVLERYERRERLLAAFAAIEGLPENQRRAIVARELEGRSHDEIAAELGLTGGAARQLIHRARAGVRSAATAVTPVGLLERLAAVGASQGTTATDMAAGGLLGGAGAKVAVAAVVAGGALGGAALVGPLERSDGEREAGRESEDRGARVAAAEPGGSGQEGGSSGSSGGSGESGSGSEGSGGPGEGANAGGGGSKGPGGGGGGNSGHGGGDSDDDGFDDDHELDDEPDFDDADNSGSGSSGSGSSGSGSSGSGSSGSGSSGSGSSGSGSGDFDSSGSGSSGSGSSGSGSSGSGSDDVPEPDELEDDELD